LETHQTPGGLHQRRAQPRIAMFGHTTLQPGVAAAVLSRAQPGIAAYLASIVEPVPVPNLAIDHHATQSANAAWLARAGGGLQLLGQDPDLLLQSQQDRLAIAEQLFHPLWDLEQSKSARLPPAGRRLKPVIDQ